VTAAQPTSEPRTDAADERAGARAGGRIRWRLPTGRVVSRRAGSRIAALVLAGGLVGYVTSALVGTLAAAGSLTGRPAEPPETRAFISAMLDRDATRLAQLQPASDVGARAAAIQESSLAEHWTPVAISYLGGAIEGPIGVYVYVIRVKGADGTIQPSAPFAFTVVDRKVVRVQ
jgi:hypothetical protein